MADLILHNNTYHTIMDFVRLCDDEIGLFGYVALDEEDQTSFHVDEVFLVKQEVTGGSVDFATTGLEYAVRKAAADGRSQDLRFCAHSHVNMDAFWSGVDEGMIRDMNSGMIPWFVSLVANKRGKTQQRVDFYDLGDGLLSHFTGQVTVNLNLVIAEDAGNRELMRELVTKPKFQAWKGGTWPTNSGATPSISKQPNTLTAAEFLGDDYDLDDIERGVRYGYLTAEEAAAAEAELPDGVVRPLLNAAGDLTGWED